jgi:hypothetical protein
MKLSLPTKNCYSAIQDEQFTKRMKISISIISLLVDMVGTSNFERLKSQYMPFDLLYFHKDMQLLGPNLLK